MLLPNLPKSAGQLPTDRGCDVGDSDGRYYDVVDDGDIVDVVDDVMLLMMLMLLMM